MATSWSPMSETAFYILLSLLKPMHGYGIIQHVEQITKGRIVLGAGTIYGTLKKLQHDHLIKLVATEDNRKIYQITDSGFQLLNTENNRLTEMVKNAGVLNHDKQDI